MIYPYRHWESAMFKQPKGVVSQDEWEKDPDTGIAALIDRYRTESFSDTLHSDPTPRIPSRTHRRAPKPKAQKPARAPKPSYADSSHSKQCRCCGKVLPREMFHRCHTSPDGLATRCKACRSAYRKEFNSTHDKRI